MEPAQLPFPTMLFDESRYKVFGVVTNRSLPGEELIHWHRERCGKSEAAHGVMKSDLGLRPDALGPIRGQRRLVGDRGARFQFERPDDTPGAARGLGTKAPEARLRFGLISIAGRVLGHARRLIVRLAEGHPASALLIEVRSRILRLAPVPTG
jgi:hypothetical protein